MKRCIPRFAGSHHRIEDGEELAHAGDQGDFLRLARGSETLIEAGDDGIKARGDQSSHVQRAPHLRPAAADRSLTLERARIAIERGDPE
jgi:hypothetical protein